MILLPLSNFSLKTEKQFVDSANFSFKKKRKQSFFFTRCTSLSAWVKINQKSLKGGKEEGRPAGNDTLESSLTLEKIAIVKGGRDLDWFHLVIILYIYCVADAAPICRLVVSCAEILGEIRCQQNGRYFIIFLFRLFCSKFYLMDWHL